MAADVDIANTALESLGIRAISALSDSVEGARSCSRQYMPCLAAELRAHRWSFAMKRVAVAADTAVPVSEYALQYSIPNDCVRLDFVGDFYVGASTTDYRVFPEVAFRVEGRKILTNMSSPLNLRYVRMTNDVAEFDPLFSLALAARLAQAVCLKLTQSATKLEAMTALYKQRIDEARGVNAIEKAPEPMPDDSWILSRR